MKQRAGETPRKVALVHALLRSLLLSLLAFAGCRCSSLSAELEGQRFTRCAQVDPPAERAVQVGPLQLSIEGRVLTIVPPGAPSGPLRIAAFSGPVGAALDARDVAVIQSARPGLVFMLGGLGDDEAVARKNLATLATLRVPTLFVAGGEDRWPLVEAAFAALGDSEAELVLHASGLREVRVGPDRFVIAAGAVFGRYALDEQACGLTADDVEVIQDATASAAGGTRTWLLSWQAPAGFGVTEGLAGSELGSPALQALALALSAQGGLFAYPEAQVGRPRAAGLSLVVPRLGGTGSQRADGSRLPPSVAKLILQPAKGLLPSP